MADNPLGWKLSVSGDVETAFTASVGDLANEESTSNVMTCTCGGSRRRARHRHRGRDRHPARSICWRRPARLRANAVTFVSADGTQQTFPLGYVVGRHAVLSHEINDEVVGLRGQQQPAVDDEDAGELLRARRRGNRGVRRGRRARDSGCADEHPNSPTRACSRERSGQGRTMTLRCRYPWASR
ncbi:MAG: hypothetical protein ACLTMP_08380 [Eggerthella lenta]